MYDPLERMIDALDASFVPAVPPHACSGDAILEAVYNADNGLSWLWVILRCLNDAPRTPALESYSERAYAKIVEAWPGIVRWMFYLLLCDNDATDYRASAFRTCTQALRMMFIDAEGHAQKEEILSQSRTVNITFHLLRRKDRQTGVFQDTLVSTDLSVISDILHRYCYSGVGRRALTEWLTTASKRTRHAVTEAVVSRALEMALYVGTGKFEAIAIGISAICDVVYRLVQSDRAILSAFQGHDFLAKFTTALYQISETPPTAQHGTSLVALFWRLISGSTGRVIGMALSYAPHPSKGIRRVAAAGMLTCALRCLPHAVQTQDPMVESLFMLLPYLYPPNPILATLSTPRLAAVWNETPSLSGDAHAIWSAIRTVYRRHAETFFEPMNLHIKMCSNLTVRILVSQLFTSCFPSVFHPTLTNIQCQEDFDPSQRRVCQGCRTSVYCSIACQTRDWQMLHSRECRELGDMYSSEQHA